MVIPAASMTAGAFAGVPAPATLWTYPRKRSRSLRTAASLALRVSTAPLVLERTAVSAVLRAAMSANSVAIGGVGVGNDGLLFIAFAMFSATEMMRWHGERAG